MVELVVKFNAKKAIADVKRAISQEQIETTNDLYNTVKRRSPVRSGLFKKSWKKTITQQNARIYNRQPYSEKLEDGYSKQAPLGIIEPAIREVIKRRQTIRKSK